MYNFCPLINGSCNRNCVFIEQGPGNFGIVDYCSLAASIKKSEDRPNAEVLLELKRLISKF